jgi:hypothetical protein
VFLGDLDDCWLLCLPTGGFAIHAPGKVHYDGAKDEEVIVQISGIGPSGTNVVNPGDAKKK